ncbi:MAG: sulfur carrier protein ThiS [Actinophytocola sp.]|nr:sulfur carrier protein ThiS [Actinophytocola sp.]
MDVEVNGEERRFPEGTTLAGLLEQLGTARRGVAVAVNGTVVTRSEWQNVVLIDGAKVDILTAVQGG